MRLIARFLILIDELTYNWSIWKPFNAVINYLFPAGGEDE